MFLTARDFRTGNLTAVVIAIDKSSIPGPTPTFVNYVSPPPHNKLLAFFIPAEMHGAQPGMPEYFVTDATHRGEIGQVVRVVTMTDFLSNSPKYVITDI